MAVSTEGDSVGVLSRTEVGVGDLVEVGTRILVPVDMTAVGFAASVYVPASWDESVPDEQPVNNTTTPITTKAGEIRILLKFKDAFLLNPFLITR